MPTAASQLLDERRRTNDKRRPWHLRPSSFVDVGGNDMLARVRNYLGLVVAYTRLNLNSQLEYRGAFLSQVVAMFLNDSVWVVFWVLFFTRFPVLRGWDVNDVLTVWAIAASG